MPSGEIGKTSIHDVETASFWCQDVEHIDFVHLAVADMNKGWNIATQIEERMHLDDRFGFAKLRLRKHAQAQIDGGRVERINRLIQFHSKAVVDIEFASSLDQAHGEICVNSAIAGKVDPSVKTIMHRV